MTDIATSTWGKSLAGLPGTVVRTVDMHTAGEPVRIVVSGYPELHGRTILEKRRDAIGRYDHLRRALMLEPRGHAGMYGVIPVPASVREAAFGVLFMHNEGYSTMCGHATIAIGRWAAETGLVASVNGHAKFQLETPCGVVPVTVSNDSAGQSMTAFESVSCFASHLDYTVEVPDFGDLTLDVAFGGAFYAILPASRIGLSLASTPLSRLVAAGTEITAAIRNCLPVSHPSEPDLSFVYGTILTDDANPMLMETTANVCVFADGQLDRSPTGSGVCARLAVDYARGRIALDCEQEFRGVSGERFSGKIVKADGSGIEARIIACVSGCAYFTGQSEFIIEPDDPFADGFKLASCIQL